MSELRSYSAADIATMVPMAHAIDALRECFAHRPSHIARSAHHAAGGEFMLMPAVADGVAGVKLLMIQPNNAGLGEPVIQGTYVLFDAARGRPVALLDGAALTNIRTPAASAVATAALARRNVRTLGIVGAGPQAIGHVEAMLCVRPELDQIAVASRTRANADAVAARIAADPVWGGERSIRSCTFAEAAACDVVCVATRSSTPVVVGDMVVAGAHVNAVGSYRTDMRELGSDLVAASTVVVDDVDAAHDEAGDLALAVDDGAWTWDRLAGDLADVAAGRLSRRTGSEITLFKSVGLAVEDLVIARLVAAADDLL